MTGDVRHGPVLLFVFAVCFIMAAGDPSRIAGKITSVDIKARTLGVQDPNSGQHTLSVDDATVIVLDGDEQATLDDLFEGDEVQSATVRELAGGKLLLVRAVVTSQPPAPPDGQDDPGDQDEPPPPSHKAG